MGLSKDLEFTATDVAEHTRRLAEAARLFNEAGLIVICAAVSPLASLRAEAALLVGGDRVSLKCTWMRPWSGARQETRRDSTRAPERARPITWRAWTFPTRNLSIRPRCCR